MGTTHQLATCLRQAGHSGILILWLLVWSIDAQNIYQPHCRDALGMHSGAIPDSAINASSSYDLRSVGPQNARIRTEKNGGAWCPLRHIDPDVYEWLEIDLGTVKKVTLVETQGRFGNGQGQEFAEQYMLEYQRVEGGTWVRYKNHKQEQLLKGNMNTYIAEIQNIDPPIIARRVRFVPYSRRPRTICMRVELYGCTWKEGIRSYSMPQGDVRGDNLSLMDYTYDGKNINGYLTGGMGQLVDDQEGITNFRLDQYGTGHKGYEWVGWKNSSSNRPIEIVFEFETVRNFSSVRLWCNNYFQKGIRVFRMAKLYFSNGGVYYSNPAETFTYMKDSLLEYARPVIIPIPHRTGRFIRMQLFFEAKWILISEINFESEVVMGEQAVEHEAPLPGVETTTPSAPTPTPTTANTKEKMAPPDVSIIEYDDEEESEGAGDMEDELDNPFVVKVKSKPDDNSEERPYHTDDSDSTNPPEPTRAVDGAIKHPNHHDDRLQEEHIGIIIGALGALILILCGVAIFIVCRRRCKKKEQGAKYSYEKQHMTSASDDFKFVSANGMMGSFHMYNSIATGDGDYNDDSFNKLKLKQEMLSHDRDPEPEPEEQSQAPPLYVKLPPEPVYQQNLQNSAREVKPPTPPEVPYGISGPPPNVPPPPIPPPPHPSALARELDFIPISKDPGSAGSRSTPSADTQLAHFTRKQLKFLEKIGDGQFGEVYLCEAFVSNHQSLPVAVKVLRENADTVTREHFLQEAHVLAGLKDPNMAQVLGVCSEQDNPISMVLEYTRQGDLNQFLKKHVSEEEPIPGHPTLSPGCQVYMATQVASGMKYLESLNLVHRDLATRNCLVGDEYVIKINDLGMSQGCYSDDYYRIEGRATLPIRWMAWESVMLGKFSAKSDVWAFAVLLWEILTFARERPYVTYTDEQVIDNCSRFFHNDGQEVYLAQPRNCSKEIYDLMVECWNREEAQRPSFREISMFLQRKNMGYNPRDDHALKIYAHTRRV